MSSFVVTAFAHVSRAGELVPAAMRGAFNPSPTPSGTTPPAELITPGVFGFTGIAIITVVVALLVWDMQRRIRRSRYREEVRAELDAEDAASRGRDEPASDAGGTPDGSPRP